jgi:hypothetical protein
MRCRCAVYRQDGSIEVGMHVPRGKEIHQWRCVAADKVVERTMGSAYGCGDVIGAEVLPTGQVRYFKNGVFQAEVMPTCPRPWVFAWETCHASKAEILDPPTGLVWTREPQAGIQQVEFDDI